jgi:hypothetical protein
VEVAGEDGDPQGDLDDRRGTAPAPPQAERGWCTRTWLGWAREPHRALAV